MKNTIPIVIIEFNTYKRTIKYIKDFLKYVVSDNVSFIIVDNSETNENYYNLKKEINKIFGCMYDVVNKDLEKCDDRIKKIELFSFIKDNIKFEIITVKSKNNYGFAIGNNIGANVAKYYYLIDIIIFSNSDIRFKQEFNLLELVNLFEKNNRIALIGPNIIGLDNKKQTPSVKMSLLRRWDIASLLWPLNKIIGLNYSNDILNVNENCFVYRIIGAFMIFNFYKFEEIGQFDETTFLYGEEIIIAEKLKKYNYLTYYSSTHTLIHEQGGSTKKSVNELKKIKLMYDSEIYYYKEYREYSFIRLLISRVLFTIYIFKLRIFKKLKLIIRS